MTTDLHDTLAAEARARHQLEHDTHDIQNKLDDIRWMYPAIADTMLTISGYAMDLTGISATSTPLLPGGDALAMLGPYSTGYNEPDDLPHPAQIIREWADRWRDATRTPAPDSAKWAAHLAVLEANTAWFVRRDTSGEFRANIRAIHGRLAALTGNSEREPTPQRGPDDIQARAGDIPDHVMLTRDEAEHFWPGQLDTTAWDRLRQRAKYRREQGEDIPPRRYPVEWIRREIGAA